MSIEIAISMQALIVVPDWNVPSRLDPLTIVGAFFKTKPSDQSVAGRWCAAGGENWAKPENELLFRLISAARRLLQTIQTLLTETHGNEKELSDDERRKPQIPHTSAIMEHSE